MFSQWFFRRFLECMGIAQGIGIMPSSSAYDIQAVTPLEGDLIQMTDSGDDGLLIINPATALTMLTVEFPQAINAKMGQMRSILFRKSIATVSTLNSTVLNPAPSMLSNDHITFQYVGSNTWARML